jgi:tetratricopeptide (TPR) repeat protein
MAADFRQFDEHGFPIPPRYSDLKFHDEDPPAARPKASLRTKRLVMLAILLGIVVPIVLGPRILATSRDFVAQWLFSRAQQRFFQGDNVGALADLNRAIDWNPNSSILYLLRAKVRSKMDQLDDSLADYTELVNLLNGNKPGLRWQRGVHRSGLLAEALMGRSWVNVRLKRNRAALDDASGAVQFAPNATTWNSRAYVRAVLNVELEDGLADINRALAIDPGNTEFLDTRGYLLHRLGRDKEGLEDMNRALAQWNQFDRAEMDQAARLELDHSLGVMFHHRGEIYQTLGEKDKAEVDIRRGENLGYDPAHGVF